MVKTINNKKNLKKIIIKKEKKASVNVIDKQTKLKDIKKIKKINTKEVAVKTVGSIELKKNKSNQNDFSDDSFNTMYGTDGIIKPPLELKFLSNLSQNADELSQCIDAMKVNISGLGGRFIPNFAKEEEENFEDIIKDRKDEELDLITETFTLINPDLSLITIRERTRVDIEATGNGYWELVRDKNGILHSIYHVESSDIRITKLHKDIQTIELPYLKRDLSIGKKKFKKKFRRYVKLVGSKKIWFKEYGDPRTLNKKTGGFVEPTDIKDEDKATEIKHFSLYNSSSIYGLPRYIANLPGLLGGRSSDEINLLTFENNNVPSMAVVVNNGMLTDGSISRIEEFVESHIKRSNNRSAFLILEAEPLEEGGEGSSKPTINIQDLTKSQTNDQLFQNYTKNVADRTRRKFRLLPILVGTSDDYSKAVSETSRKLAEEQIFNPERLKEDEFINKLVLELGITLFKFKSNTPNVTDNEEIIDLVAKLERSGGITPNTAIEAFNDVFNKEIPPYDAKKVGFNPDIPFSLTMAHEVKNIKGEPPNQGQIPKPKEPQTEVEESIDKFFSDPNKFLDRMISINENVTKKLDDDIHS